MLKILSNYEIIVTRGDSISLDLNLYQDGEPYIVSTNETVHLTINNWNLTELKFHQENRPSSPTSAFTFIMSSGDTNALSAGRYRYDIKIVGDNGREYTLMYPTVFQVVEGTINE